MHQQTKWKFKLDAKILLSQYEPIPTKTFHKSGLPARLHPPHPYGCLIPLNHPFYLSCFYLFPTIGLRTKWRVRDTRNLLTLPLLTSCNSLLYSFYFYAFFCLKPRNFSKYNNETPWKHYFASKLRIFVFLKLTALSTEPLYRCNSHS